MRTIEETLDCFDYADSMLESLIEKKNDEDGLTLAELAGSFAENAPEGVAAYIGSSDIAAEMRDLDDKEKDELVDRSLELVQKILELAKP